MYQIRCESLREERLSSSVRQYHTYYALTVRIYHLLCVRLLTACGYIDIRLLTCVLATIILSAIRSTSIFTEHHIVREHP